MTISIHPKVAEISYMANNAYAAELLKRLENKDARRKRTLHQSTIDEIKSFHNEYTLGAEQYFTPGYSWRHAALDTFGFLLMLFGIYCLYVLAWAVMS